MKRLPENLRVFFLVTLFVVLIALPASVLALSESNNVSSVSSITSGTTQTPGYSCPSWSVALDRIGSDSGQLKLEFDSCLVFDYEVTSYPQGSEPGLSINLDPGDFFVVWDEDECHGRNMEDCTFSGESIASSLNSTAPNEYIRASTNDSNTEWTVYTVTSSGTFTVIGTGLNEHEAIRINIKLLDFEIEDGIDQDPNQINCVQPDQEITYAISWDNSGPNDLTFNDVYVINYLPDGTTYKSSTGTPDPNYNSIDHSYTWYIGDIVPIDSGSVTLTVTVDDTVEPGTILYSTAEMHSGVIVLARNTDATLVCCQWDGFAPNTIFVDSTAKGTFNGTNWQNAYTNLQDALYRAESSICNPAEGYAIYVAQGTYSPGELEDDTFALYDHTAIYGGFKTGGTDIEYRNPDKYETILSGLIDVGENKRNKTVVTMAEATVLDGFTVTDGLSYGVYGSEVSFKLENCGLSKNIELGVFAENGNVDIKWCCIERNGFHGIEHSGANYTINIENSVINFNQRCGLYTTSSTPTIINSVIAQNGSSRDGFNAISITLPSTDPLLQNNTIAYNSNAGIAFFNDDPNSILSPDIKNCILWYNNDNQNQILGHNPDTLSYSCIFDSNDLYGTDYKLDANNNFTGKPEFAYSVPGQYDDPAIKFNPHLAHNSPCIDMGDPHLDYDGQTDIDFEPRKPGIFIDIGADEVYSSTDFLSPDDIYTKLDWDADGCVDYKDFAILSHAWLAHDPCDPALYDPDAPEYTKYNNSNGPDFVDDDDLARWNNKYNLANTGESTYIIDKDDLSLFCEDSYWLWTAIWLQSQSKRFNIPPPYATPSSK